MAPKPFVSPDVIERAVTGAAEPADGQALAIALMRLADTLAAVMRTGVSDRDYPTLVRAEATSTMIDCHLLAESTRRHHARRQQRTLFATGASENIAAGFFARLAAVQQDG